MYVHNFCSDAHRNTLSWFLVFQLCSLKNNIFHSISNSKLVKSTFDEEIPRHCTHRSSRPSDNCNFYSSEYSTFSILITRHAPHIIYVFLLLCQKQSFIAAISMKLKRFLHDLTHQFGSSQKC